MPEDRLSQARPEVLAGIHWTDGQSWLRLGCALGLLDMERGFNQQS